MEIRREKSLRLRNTIGRCLVADRPYHWHNSFEICLIINKTCRFIIDGRLFCAKPGDIITVNDNCVHKFIVDYDDTYIRTIQFPASLLLNMSKSVLPIKTHISAEEITKNPEFKSAFDSLVELMDNENTPYCVPEDSPYLQSLFLAMFFLLMHHFPDNEYSDSLKTERNDFYRIVEYINTNFTGNINIKSISANLYIPSRKTSSLFKKYSGVDISNYIDTLRINNANRLLKDGLSITEAALESGFQCIRTFNYKYKEIMGITPTEHLKN